MNTEVWSKGGKRILLCGQIEFCYGFGSAILAKAKVIITNANLAVNLDVCACMLVHMCDLHK